MLIRFMMMSIYLAFCRQQQQYSFEKNKIATVKKNAVYICMLSLMCV